MRCGFHVVQTAFAQLLPCCGTRIQVQKHGPPSG
jgi:hypothetical protein